MTLTELAKQIRALAEDLDKSLPTPKPEQVRRLAELATRLAAEAEGPPLPFHSIQLVEMEEALNLLCTVINSNHPPDKIYGTLADNKLLLKVFQTLWAIRASTLALSTGDLAVDIEAKGFMAGALKTLQAHFRHLTWQTQRVADGDFSQRVDFMGEFATAFNAMTQRLASTLDALRQKEAELTTKNQELEKEIQTRRQVEAALRESEERYREMAIVDHLTGLYNRRHFYVLAENEIKRARRHIHDLALVMLDIDRFKLINDRHGHDCGDRVLVKISRILLDITRSVDICARLGGEEFVLVLPETSIGQAASMAERLREYIAKARVDSGKQKVGVTASLGVTCIRKLGENQHGSPREVLEALIKQADRALYGSKEAGRDRVIVFDKSANNHNN
ncbi:MAG: diguanylate cyclase [Deltaproteobacteria bacterium]|nr:diguanylate cyclase [Deltaproteobacteria bacterium]